MINIQQLRAIQKLYPNVVSTIGDVAYDIEGNEVAYDLDAIETYINSQLYVNQRAAEYPSIGDQLDALFHAGVFPEAMAAEIQAIKDKYPKS